MHDIITKEQSEMLMLMNHPFARPLLHWAVRCTCRPYPLILRNLILTLKCQIILARSCVGITVQFWCQMKEDELNFVKMNIVFYE